MPSEPNPRVDVARGVYSLVVEITESRPSPRSLDDEAPAIPRMGVFPTAPAFTPVEDSGCATPQIMVA